MSIISSELQDVPLLCNAAKTQKIIISKSLQLSEESRQAMETHVALVGINKNRFIHTQDEQSKFHIHINLDTLLNHFEWQTEHLN